MLIYIIYRTPMLHVVACWRSQDHLDIFQRLCFQALLSKPLSKAMVVRARHFYVNNGWKDVGLHNLEKYNIPKPQRTYYSAGPPLL